MERLLLRLMLTLLSASVTNAGPTIFCNAAPAFIGETSNITCHFHKDIKANKIAFSVAKSSHTSGKGEDVLQCSWTQQSDRPECLVSNGYSFDYDVTDSLTLQIPSVTSNFAGLYSCHIVPPNGAKVEQCNLIAKPSARHAMTQAPKNHPSHTGSPEWLLPATFAMVVILTILMIIVVAYLIWKEKRLRCSCPRRRGAEDAEECQDEENKEESKPLNTTEEKAEQDDKIKEEPLQKETTMDYIAMTSENGKRGVGYQPPLTQQQPQQQAKNTYHQQYNQQFSPTPISTIPTTTSGIHQPPSTRQAVDTYRGQSNKRYTPPMSTINPTTTTRSRMY